MGRIAKNLPDLGCEILGAVIANGYSQEEAAAVVQLSKSAWNDRLHDPGLFRAREIRQFRKLIPDAVCDKISR